MFDIVHFFKPSRALVAQSKMDPSSSSLDSAARKLVMEIAEKRGYLAEEELGETGTVKPHLRQIVEEATRQKDLIMGSAAMT